MYFKEKKIISNTKRNYKITEYGKWKSEGDFIYILPVFPSLETRFVEKEVKRLPIVEDLVAVVDDVRCGAHVPQHG